MSDAAISFRRRRIALVGPFPPQPGDLSEQASLLGRLLREEGAWVQQVNTDVPRVRRLPAIGVYLLPLAQALAVTWRLLVALPRSDVLHVLAGSGWDFWLPVTLALFFGKVGRRRVVVTCSGSAFPAFLQRSWRWILPLLRRAGGLAVATGYGQELLQRFGLYVTVTPPLLVLEEHPLLARSSWPPLLLWLDDLEPRANPPMALRALARLREGLPEARLLMVGSGPLAQEVQSLACSLGVAGAVAYRPHLSPRQRRDAIREASVIWRTSGEDDLPQLLLEAAAAGTVIVATAVGGVAELVDDGVDGMVVLPGDAAALAQVSARVLSRPLLAESLANNARLSVERFTWRRQRARLAGLYDLAPAAALPDQEPGDEAADEVLGRAEFLWSDPGRGAREDRGTPGA